MTWPIQRLLVPIDPSDRSKLALPSALLLGRRARVPIVLFNWSVDEEGAAEAKRCLGDLAADLPGVTVEVAVAEHSSAARSVGAAAERSGATVVMAAHGRSGVGRMLLGSVAEETLGLLRGPSVLVGPAVVEGERAGGAALAACVDGSPWSEAVLPVASGWARQLKLPLLLVHVREPDASYGSFEQSPEEMESTYLDGLASRVDPAAPPDHALLWGEPAQAIASLAHERADLVAMVTHVRGGLARTVLGSIAMQVVHHSQRPVLVVPRQRA